MDLNTERAIDHWLGPALCAGASALARLLPRRAPVTPPRAVLVILLSEMGSMVCTQPMWRRLKERYPQARLYALVLRKNRAVIDLLGEIPPDHVLTISDAGLGDFLRGSLAAIRTMRRLGIDTVIDCELFARVSALYSWLSGAAVRVGFHSLTQEGLYRGSLVTRRVPYNPYVHIARQFLTLAEAIDSATIPPGKGDLADSPPALEPLRFDPAELERSTGRLHADYPALAGRPLVLVFPGVGILPIRGWPVDGYAELARALIGHGYAVAVIGPPEDRGLGERIVAHAADPVCVNLAGYTANIAALMPLFHRAELLIGNDGGPCHFAALTPVRVLTLFGPETPRLYAPLARTAETIYRPLACSPCLTAYNHRRTYCDGVNLCLRQIGVPTVLEAALRLLATARA